ncbi:hypothetical protein BZG21_41190, partial [Escherichia coli]|nr:hypothetical protein [Escherichia coli]
MTIVERRDFIPTLPQEANEQGSDKGRPKVPHAGHEAQLTNDPDIVSNLIKENQASIEQLKHDIQSKSGLDAMDFILEDIQQLKKLLFDPQSSAVIMTAM